jgi:drug/metabolite transporter (DMT)-like permease
MSSPVTLPDLSATPSPLAPANAWQGYGFGLMGVAVFSLTLPMTRVAVQALDPLLVGFGRALLAALPALVWLAATRSRRPRAEEWPGILLAALGIVIGWPLASTFAMQSVPSSHGAIVNGLLPLSTALFAAWRSHERLPRAFWLFALLGAAIVVGFALAEGGGRLQTGDLWLLFAVVLGGMGYAEGARVARTLGGGRTICWALAACAPFTLAPVIVLGLRVSAPPAADVLAACAYLGFGSMFLGFFAWYRGLAMGGIARVGQVQLLQPFLTVVAAALLFGEPVSTPTFICAVAVIAVIAAGKRASAHPLKGAAR